MSNKILIIDAMNTFIRNYVMNPSLASDGSPIGGTKGFLMSLQKMTREIQPDSVIVVWDGGGGSSKRRTIVKEYKEGRKPLKLNRAYKGMSSLEESQNRYDQMRKTVEYLNAMPVAQLMIEDIEADDVIAYICQMPSIRDDVKIIVSMDKDFYQLCDDKTMIYSPVKNEFLNKKRILEKFSIHPNNFAIARAIDGDKSDNLDGIKGAGLKTIANKFSFLAEEKSYTLDELFKHCRHDNSGLKLYKNILEEKNKVKINYKLMQLYSPYISTKSSQHIKDTIENFNPKFNLTSVMKMMSQDGIHQYNWNNLFQKFRLIVDQGRH
jgi:DNA polymerase-1|tara:strand:+ start:184 stop:1149 length:966 start_codon:yes stop_codon:yes gene_type:complete